MNCLPAPDCFLDYVRRSITLKCCITPFGQKHGQLGEGIVATALLAATTPTAFMNVLFIVMNIKEREKMNISLIMNAWKAEVFCRRVEQICRLTL